MCTRVLWNDNPLAKVAARSMDWPVSTEPVLTVFPAGIARDGGVLGGHRLPDENPLTWTSKHGSVVTSIYGVGTVDGVNEHGLAGHALYLAVCEFEARDPAKPSVHAALWLQLLLDQAATVAEALAILEGVQVTMVEVNGYRSNLHLALEDASGDSAVIEFVGGEMQVHHGAQYTIMTNDPPFAEQLALLAEQDYSNPSRDMPLPGNVNARDRFQRCAFFMALLPDPKNVREAVAGPLAIVRNASVPFGAPYGEFGIYNTEYRTVVDVTNLRYFFELTTSPNLMWIDLAKVDLTSGASVRTLNPDDIALAGEVSDRMTAAASAPF
jgi:penicillin V acylase-like amidase (Ntn superfamily)